MVTISDRPAQVEDRSVSGHWEGDLIVGKGRASAVGTLVKRSIRFVVLLHSPFDHWALAVEKAMRDAISNLPSEVMRNITWDQGRKIACQLNFTITTGVRTYFCDPHLLWQRGSNENTNGLLRQHLPIGTVLLKYSAKYLEESQRSLNGRPRRTLGYMLPEEKLTKLFALSP